MKKNFLVFVAIVLVAISFYLFDFFSFDGEINITSEIYETSIIKVYITGEINSPGVYEINADDRLEDLIKIAGGLTSDANISNINMAMVLKDGAKVVIPSTIINKTEKNIDLNTMNLEDFMNVDGIGEVLAQRIIDFRLKQGFLTFDDLIVIEGIGESKSLLIKEYLEN